MSSKSAPALTKYHRFAAGGGSTLLLQSPQGLSATKRLDTNIRQDGTEANHRYSGRHDCTGSDYLCRPLRPEQRRIRARISCRYRRLMMFQTIAIAGRAIGILHPPSPHTTYAFKSTSLLRAELAHITCLSRLLYYLSVQFTGHSPRARSLSPSNDRKGLLDGRMGLTASLSTTDPSRMGLGEIRGRCSR